MRLPHYHLFSHLRLGSLRLRNLLLKTLAAGLQQVQCLAGIRCLLFKTAAAVPRGGHLLPHLVQLLRQRRDFSVKRRLLLRGVLPLQRHALNLALQHQSTARVLLLSHPSLSFSRRRRRRQHAQRLRHLQVVCRELQKGKHGFSCALAAMRCSHVTWLCSAVSCMRRACVRP